LLVILIAVLTLTAAEGEDFPCILDFAFA